jgi:hypothetical protein
MGLTREEVEDIASRTASTGPPSKEVQGATPPYHTSMLLQSGPKMKRRLVHRDRHVVLQSDEVRQRATAFNKASGEWRRNRAGVALLTLLEILK